MTDFLVDAAHQLPEGASEARKKMGPLWPEASLATSYALATSPESASFEAKNFVRDAMKYYKFCLSRTGSAASGQYER